MAIYHCSAKIISRSSGRSAVGSSAYRSGEKLYNKHDGVSHDYTNKKDVVYSEIMLCENAPIEFKDRQTLWNEVEKIEKAKNSQLAREIEIALPIELNFEEQKKLVQNYVKDNFINAGMCADVNIHDNGKGNPHAHIMLTMRAIDEQGKFMPKAKKIYALDDKGEKIYNKKTRQYKSTRENTTDWDSKEKLELWRKDLADKINHELEKKNIPERVDHRSFEKQGIEKLPTIHLGSSAHQQEQKGIKTDRGNYNREIEKQNKQLEQINKQLEELKPELEKLKQELKEPKEKTLTAKECVQDITLKQQQAIKNILEIRKEYQQIGLYKLQIKSIPDQLKNMKQDFQDIVKLENSKTKNIKEYQKLKNNHKPIFNNTTKQQEQVRNEIDNINQRLTTVKNHFSKKYNSTPTKKGYEVKTILLKDEYKQNKQKLDNAITYEELTEKEKNINLDYKENILLLESRPDFEIIDKSIKEIVSDLLQKSDFENIKLGNQLNRLTIADRKELTNRLKEKNINPKVLEIIENKTNNLEKEQKERRQIKEIEK